MSKAEPRNFVPLLGACLALALALGLTACGSDSSGTSSSGGGGSSTSGANGNGEGGGAEAAAAIKPYVGQPSAFPVTEELAELPTGATVAYMDAGLPTGAIFWDLFQPAAETMGIELTRIKAGPAANAARTAFDSVVAQKPDAVIVLGVNIDLWHNQLEELQEEGIPVVTGGVLGTEPYGIEAPQQADVQTELAGRLMADYVAAEMGGESNVGIYYAPEISFTPLLVEAFNDELEEVCPRCSSREITIPASTVGNTAPSTIVSDLQAHPQTDVTVYPTDEVQIGVPSALQAAGLQVKTLGYAPGPANLQYVKEGKETAVLGVDLPVLSWTMIDLAAREMAGQKVTGPEGEGITDIQFLTQEDITFDTSKGWTGYPDFAERFAKLWGVAAE